MIDNINLIIIITLVSIILTIIRFVFLNDERNSIILKKLNNTEEEKISFLEKAFSENNSDIYKNLTDIQKNQNKSVIEPPQIVQYYPNSKSEIIDVLYSKIDLLYYLGNFFFSVLSFSIIVHKHFDFDGDVFPSIVGLVGFGNIII